MTFVECQTSCIIGWSVQPERTQTDLGKRWGLVHYILTSDSHHLPIPTCAQLPTVQDICRVRSFNVNSCAETDLKLASRRLHLTVLASC